MGEKVYITYGYEGGEFFSRTHSSEPQAKSFIENFYRWKLSHEPDATNWVSLTIATVNEEMNATEALKWAEGKTH